VTPRVAELVLDSRARIGEGPLWDHERARLLWVDIPANALHEFDPQSGTDTVTDVGQPIGAVAVCARGGLVAALRDGFGFLPPEGRGVSGLVEVEKDRPANRMNDGKCDCRGRFWAGTMAWDHTPGAGSLYCLERSAGGCRVSVVLTGLTVANGLDWSPDNRRMYYIDSPTQRVDVFDFDAARGAVSNRRTFVAIPPSDGMPDGMVVDAEGGVWVALFGGGRIRRYAASGEIDIEVRVPVTLVTSCGFGGPHLDQFYITTARHRLTPEEAMAQPTAGGVFVCRPGPVGRPPFRFG
jgi:sugar lactone lactonase YvrE